MTDIRRAKLVFGEDEAVHRKIDEMAQALSKIKYREKRKNEAEKMSYSYQIPKKVVSVLSVMEADLNI